MAPGQLTRAPTTCEIPNTYKIPSTTRSLVKSLSRLSRNSLIDLALNWLQDGSQAACGPYLASNRNIEEEAEEDYLYTPAENAEELRKTYESLKDATGSKRDLIDRIVDGDWRRGISLQQLAMIDFQHLQEHENALRWTALKLVPLGSATKENTYPLKRLSKPHKAAPFPRIHPSTFLQSLQREISPLVKAHYYLHRLNSPHNLTILRLYVADTPYAHPRSATESYFTDSARTLYIAFPDSCPYIYVALSGSGGGGKVGGPSKIDVTALKRTVLEAVPKAFSRAQERYALETTALTARSLSTMCALRGNGRYGGCQGAYSIFADACVDKSPVEAVKERFEEQVINHDDSTCQGLEDRIITRPENRKRRALEETDANVQTPSAEDVKLVKKRKIDVAARFGTTGLPDAGRKTSIDTLHIKLEEKLNPTKSVAAAPSNQPDDSGQVQGPTKVKTRSTGLTKCSLLDKFNPEIPPQRTAPDQPWIRGAQGNHQQHQDPAAPLPVTLTFHGSDVFAGIRKLAEMGYVDLEKMPAWMTGEECVSVGVVRGGAVIDGRGGGA